MSIMKIGKWLRTCCRFVHVFLPLHPLQSLCARCTAGGDLQAGVGVSSSSGKGGGGRSLVGRSVQQLVSRGAGAVQHLIGAKYVGHIGHST